MKIFKKWLQYSCTAFGLHFVLMFVYFLTVENPASDWFISAVTGSLSAIISLWICDIKKE